MTSHDLRDVLNLPQDGTAPRPSKKQKTAAPRPNLKGLAREVQNLGGDHPISIVPEISLFKKRRQASRKPAAKWELRPFRNSARDDSSLVLRHWRRKDSDGRPAGAPAPGGGDEPMEDAEAAEASGPAAAEELEDSLFAKFNVQVDVPQYNDDQYNSKLRSEDWTRDETDYLLEVVREFDLRWPIIWDQYDYRPRLPDGGAASGQDAAIVPMPKERSMEDLKARYYEVAAEMMVVQKPAQYMTQPEFTLYDTMRKFDPAAETLRKQFAITAMNRSKEEAREEESLLLEVKRILARQERFNEERRDLYARLDFPVSDQDISSFKSSAGLQQLLQTLMTADKSKKRKSIAGPDGVSPASAGLNGQPPSSATVENRRESIAAASASGHRDSIGGGAGEKATPTTEAPPKNNKKGAQHQERRKLSEQEEQVYGVSHHERLGSGPTFRYERVNKLFSHKSGQQQLRITNVLNELDIPARLTMPTAAVTAQFEQLVITVTQLVDLRKQIDKLDGEIKIEQARRAEKDKVKAPPSQGIGADGTSDARDAPANADARAVKRDARAASASADRPAPPGDRKANGHAPGAADDDDGPPTAKGDGAEARANGTGAVNGDSAHQADASAGANKDGDVEDKDKLPARPSSRPGSSGAHKRSASVLSTTSDKSSKRLKK